MGVMFLIVVLLCLIFPEAWPLWAITYVLWFALFWRDDGDQL